MTRLIDADALKDDILKSAVMIDDRGIQTGYEIAIELIKRQPTVDAIPIEWIEEWCISQNLTYIKIAVEKLLDEWREENDEAD